MSSASRRPRICQNSWVCRAGHWPRSGGQGCVFSRLMKLWEPKCDSDHDRLVEWMAKLEEELFAVMDRNAELKEENARLRGEVADLKQQLAAARKNSSTSSKPPSSDIVKPEKPLPKGGKKRSKDGQPGHEQHLRSPFPPKGGQPLAALHARLLPGLRPQAGRFAL